MSAASNPIVLSSSPERIVPRASALTTHNFNESVAVSLRDSSPDAILSPSSFCRLPTRSRYFPKESLSDEPRTEHRPRRGTPPKSSEKRENRANKGKRSISEPTPVSNDVQTPLLAQKANAPKRTSGSNKKRGKCNKSENSTNKILTGRVAKSGSMTSQESDKKTTDALQCGSSRQKLPKRSDDEGNDDLQLEAALKRRLDWTPTKDTPIGHIDTSQEGSQGGSSKDFGNLLVGYSFNGTSSACYSDPELRFDSGPTKRRRINLVDNSYRPSKGTSNDTIVEEITEDSQNGDKPPESKRQSKKRTKKFTTLTARVTARYQSDHMHARHQAENADEVIESSDANVSKPKRKRTSKSKPQQPEVVILSPEEAVKSLNEQDLIFGTCSQLEREESPTMIRDMQAAILESERAMASQSTSSLLQSSGRGLLSTSAVSRFRAPKSLWSVAARDLDGSLIDAEVVDLTESPGFKSPKGNKQNTVGSLSEETSFEEKMDELDVLFQPSKRIYKPHEASKPEAPEDTHPSMPNYNDFTDIELSERVTKFGFKPLKNRRKMVEILEKCWETRNGSHLYFNGTPGRQAGPAPRASHATSARPQIDEERTRNTKRSQKATKLKTAPASQRTTKADNTLRTAAESTRGSARGTASRTQLDKALSTTSYRNVEEIEDSEEEIIPSPSRLQNKLRIIHSPKDTTSLAVTNNPSNPPRTLSCADSSDADKGDPSDMADQITKAVRAQSSAGPGTRSCPTWHEKILMYDPIILEDFTAWLNTEGLGLVSEDEEVNVGSVRQWCESRGICCCYRRLNKN